MKWYSSDLRSRSCTEVPAQLRFAAPMIRHAHAVVVGVAVVVVGRRLGLADDDQPPVGAS